MRLEHGFVVPVPVERAWDVLLDLPRVVPCMPGAALTSYQGDEFGGTVKVKVGPISLTYQGQGRIAERSPDDRRTVIEASGRDRRGGGTAKATVTATLRPEADWSTRVEVTTDLMITGRPAQFGRGMMVDVGNKLIGQFADCLSRRLSGGEAAVPEGVGVSVSAGTAPGGAVLTTPTSGVAPVGTARPAQTAPLGAEAATGTGVVPVSTTGAPPGPTGPMEHEVEPIDLLGITGAQDLVKRSARYAATFAAGLFIGWLIFRRRAA